MKSNARKSFAAPHDEDLIVSQITSFKGETKHPSSTIPETEGCDNGTIRTISNKRVSHMQRTIIIPLHRAVIALSHA